MEDAAHVHKVAACGCQSQPSLPDYVILLACSHVRAKSLICQDGM